MKKLLLIFLLFTYSSLSQQPVYEFTGKIILKNRNPIVILYFSTIDERDIKYFAIERSLANEQWREFNPIMYLLSNGKPSEYTFIDSTIDMNNKYQYRIKIFFENGADEIYDNYLIWDYITSIDDALHATKEILEYLTPYGERILGLESYSGLYLEVYKENGIIKIAKRYKL